MYLKHYRDDASRHRAEQNYRWLAGLPGPLRLPRLRDHQAQCWRSRTFAGGRPSQATW